MNGMCFPLIFCCFLGGGARRLWIYHWASSLVKTVSSRIPNKNDNLQLVDMTQRWHFWRLQVVLSDCPATSSAKRQKLICFGSCMAWVWYNLRFQYISIIPFYWIVMCGIVPFFQIQTRFGSSHAEKSNLRCHGWGRSMPRRLQRGHFKGKISKHVLKPKSKRPKIIQKPTTQERLEW